MKICILAPRFFDMPRAMIAQGASGERSPDARRGVRLGHRNIRPAEACGLGRRREIVPLVGLAYGGLSGAAAGQLPDASPLTSCASDCPQYKGPRPKDQQDSGKAAHPVAER